MASKSKLHRMACEGNLEGLKKTLTKEDLDTKCPLGWTLLTYACMSGRSDVVQYLLEAGSNPNLTGDGWVPLHEAANRGLPKIVKLLLEFGADVDVRIDGKSPLHVACIRGHSEVVKVLVEMEADVDAQDDIGLTGLHHTAARGKCDIVRFLIDNGARINVEDDVGWTPLDFAIDWGKADIVRILLASGANVGCVDKDGMMPLHHATNEGALPVVQVLLEYGADVNATIGDGWTALHEACRRGHKEVVELLLSSGAHPNDATSDGWTALHEACRKNRPDIVDNLLQAGANPNVTTTERWTPLLEACAIGNGIIVTALLESGVEPTTSDRRGFSPLYLAEVPAIVTLLLAYGADSDGTRCSHKNTTQLMCAYEQARLKHTHLISAFEQHFILMDAAGFRLGAANKARDPPTMRDWDSPKRQRLLHVCQAELAEMKQKRIDGFSSYSDVLYQRLSAIRGIASLPLDDCLAWFPHYGELIRSRFVLGRRKLALLNRCSRFFTLTSLPHLPIECVEEILDYLPAKDLESVLVVCKNAL